MFNLEDHNRKGTQKEVIQCCNCCYNDHSVNDKNYPCIICTNPKAAEILHSFLGKKQGFVYVAYDIGDIIGDELVYSKDFKNQLNGFPFWCPLENGEV